MRLKVDALSFSYESKPTLLDIDLQVAGGELFGLLGPNGAGKTTLITLLAGLLQPATGSISIDGHPLQSQALLARARLGLVFQSISLDRFMTVAENLQFAGGLQGLGPTAVAQRIETLNVSLPIKPWLSRKVLTLSGGQQRIVDIARALMHAPPLLILDEPTHGLDVIAREQVWRLLDDVRRQPHGPAVLVSTHLMDEAATCDRVAFLKAGELMWTGSPTEALAQLPPQIQAPAVPTRTLAQWFVWRAGQ